MTKQAPPQPIELLKTYPAYVPEHYEKLDFSKKVTPKEEFSRFFTSEAGVRADNLDFFLHTKLSLFLVRGGSSRYLFF